MPARIKHMAIVSDNFLIEERFYQAAFGLKSSSRPRPDSAPVVTDGYVGLNINPRAAGRQAGFDHFGVEVDDVAAIEARVREAYTTVHLLKRPSNRPFAGISMHDPAGNVFDLSQKDMTNRADVYADEALAKERYPRRFKHFQLRTVDPVGVARFYRDVLDLAELEKDAGDPSCYLSDGRITLIVAPWRIENYLGTGIERPALDHIGFEVESIRELEADLEALAARIPALGPRPFKGGAEGSARLKLLTTCRYGQYQLADPDGVLIDVSEG
jgi:catechol 2,3-dioxygenase-like lactoylglutathione lyase family enzyme